MGWAGEAASSHHALRRGEARFYPTAAKAALPTAAASSENTADTASKTRLDTYKHAEPSA